jgi:aminopeptidase S
VFTKTGTAGDVDGAWRNVYLPVDAWKGQTIRIHIEAIDGGSNSTIEAQIDDVRVTRGS